MMEIEIIKLGGLVIKKELISPSFLLTLKRDKKYLLVVSAIGRKDDPYSTDGLKIGNDHLSLKERDRLLAIGETYSVCRVCSFLRSKGYKCGSLGLMETPFITDSHYGNASFLKYTKSNLIELFDSFNIVIAPGFIGRDINGNPTTMGRESSDYSAILYARYLDVKRVSYIKELEGIYMSKGHELIEELLVDIDYEKGLELSKDNLYPLAYKAIEYAKRNSVELYIYNRKRVLLGSVGCISK